MIGALLKQDFISSRRMLFAAGGIMYAVIFLALIPLALNVPVIGALAMSLAIFLTVILGPVLFVLLLVFYWQSMYGQRGYFTMVIPVRGRTLYWAKVLYMQIVAVVGMVMVALAGVAIVWAFAFGQDMSLGDVMDTVRQILGEGQMSLGFLWLLAGMLALQFVLDLVSISAIMSIGAQSQFNQLGIGAPIIGYVIYYAVSQVVNTLAIVFIPLGLVVQGPDAGQIVPRGMWSLISESFSSPESVQVVTMGLGSIFTSILLAGIMGWWGQRSVDRHTSLR